jgi:hypothetical protein
LESDEVVDVAEEVVFDVDLFELAGVYLNEG